MSRWHMATADSVALIGALIAHVSLIGAAGLLPPVSELLGSVRPSSAAGLELVDVERLPDEPEPSSLRAACADSDWSLWLSLLRDDEDDEEDEEGLWLLPWPLRDECFDEEADRDRDEEEEADLLDLTTLSGFFFLYKWPRKLAWILDAARCTSLSSRSMS